MPRRIEQPHLATKDAEINEINDSTNHPHEAPAAFTQPCVDIDYRRFIDR